MTRSEFLAALRRRLSHLPPEEQDAALKYYEEYFEEAESEEEAARQLGSPDAIADRILADYGAGRARAAEKKPGRSPWFYVAIVSLCILFSPVILGVGGAALAAALTIACLFLVAVVGVIGGFLCAALALLAAFVILLGACVPAFASFPPAGTLLLGASLACAGMGALLGVFTGYLCYWTGLLFRAMFTCGRRKKGAKAK